MKVYLDVSCLNRPFDDQSQAGIRLEAEAVTIILGRVDGGLWRQVSSEMAVIETDAIPDADRRARVRLLLPPPPDILKLDDTTWDRGAVCQRLTRIGAGYGFEVLDLTEPLRRDVHWWSGPYFDYDGHWNARGHAIAARTLRDFLERPGWLPAS